MWRAVCTKWDGWSNPAMSFVGSAPATLRAYTLNCSSDCATDPGAAGESLTSGHCTFYSPFGIKRSRLRTGCAAQHG